jgi:hypothetical protein
MSGKVPEAELAGLLTRAEAIRATRYTRRSAYCGGSDPVPDGVDVRLLRAWLEDCLGYVRRVHGPGSELALRLAERLSRDSSIEELEGALADLAGADK